LAAKENDSPILFAATLNQVDCDRGYTGWNQKDFVELVKKISKEMNFENTAVIALDHGGPWLKDRQRIESYDFERAMSGVKQSVEECVAAGYDMLHIDATVDARLKQGEIISIHTVVDWTLQLIVHAEKFRNKNGIAPISYEVGTEEVHGGLADMAVFHTFLKELKAGLVSNGLGDVWPKFVVGKVGTDLHTTYFDPEVASELVKAAEQYGSVIKGHYSDSVSNPEAYPATRMGGANVGPEFTEIEYDTLVSLEKKESASASSRSNLEKELQNAVEESGRWKKWLQADEKGKRFSDLTPARKAWITKTGCRYIWTSPRVVASRKKLASNLAKQGIDVEDTVVRAIAKCMKKYFDKFNLSGIEKDLAKIIMEMKK